MLTFVFQIGDQQTNFSADVDMTDNDSATQIQYSSGDNTVTVGRMQNVLPGLTLGGVCDAPTALIQIVELSVS